jgi:hypothetical protein
VTSAEVKLEITNLACALERTKSRHQREDTRDPDGHDTAFTELPTQ